MSTDEFKRAATRGELETVRRLVQEEGLDVNTRLGLNVAKQTALHLAARYGHSEVVQFLLENYAYVNARECWGDTPLHAAFRRQDNNIQEVIQLLIDHKADTNIGDSAGCTSLHYAVTSCGLKVVQSLLASGADVTARSKDGRTSLHRAIQSGADVEVVQCLLDREADVNARTKNGQTPLLYAIYNGADLAVVQCLLNSGADVAARSKDNRATLLHALELGADTEVIKCLLDHKADVNHRGNNGVTALHYAIRGGADLAVVRLIVDCKAYMNAVDRKGNAALHDISNHEGIAIPDVMELLISNGADACLKNFDLQTPLHCFVIRGCIEAVAAFLDHLRSNGGQDMVQSALLAVDQTKRMPFHHAENVEMAKLLLEQPLKADDQLVPRACPIMLFAKNCFDRSLLDYLPYAGPLHDYLVSYTDLPLTVTAAATAMCEHRPKRRRYDVAVRLNPMLNEFQSSIAEAFLHKWDGWSTLFVQKEDNHYTANAEDDDYLLPVELKRAVMAYLSTVDAMMIRATSS